MPRSLRLLAGVVAGATALALGGCSGDEPDTRSSGAAAPESSTSASASPSGSPSASGSASAGMGTKKPYAQRVVDDVMGHRIEFTGVVRGFSSKEFTNVTEDGGEFVLVQVKATAGEKYSGGVNGGWKLESPDGSANPSTSIVEADMKAAGYEPFERLSRGESGTGWVAFQVNSASPSYTLVYTRQAAKVIGSDTTIPAKTWEFPLS
ncbi:MAG: hypothetical protein ACRCY8_09290 [Dermatophilaceae bacterium]